MRFLFTIILFTFFNDLIGQDAWSVYKSPENDFEVNMPGLPSIKNKDLHVEIGTLKHTSYNLKMDPKDKNFLYSIHKVTYPESTFNNDSIELNYIILTESIKSMSELLKCKIVYVNNDVYEGNLCNKFRLTDDLSGQVVKGVTIMNNDRIYTLMSYTMLDRSLNDDIDKFLNSFHLINKI